MALSANGENPDGRNLAAKPETANGAAARGAASTAAPAPRAGRLRTPGPGSRLSDQRAGAHPGRHDAAAVRGPAGLTDVATALLDAGVDVNQKKGGDHVSALLIATINGHFDLATMLLERGANPNLVAENGVGPLYAAINLMWAPRAGYPQPRAHLNQRIGYLEYMKKLLEKGADPNARVTKKVWYSNYNFDQSGVEETGVDGLLARRLRRRRRRDEAADVVRRRPAHPDGQDARTRRVRRRRPARDRRRLGRAAGAGGRPRHPDAARLDRRGLRRGLRRQLAPLRARRACWRA